MRWLERASGIKERKPRELQGHYIRASEEWEAGEIQRQIELRVAAMLVGMLAGGSPAGGTCPVATVVIVGGGAGDQSAGSPEVKVLVGWVRTWSAPTGGQANRQVVTQVNGSEAPKLRVLTRIGV